MKTKFAAALVMGLTIAGVAAKPLAGSPPPETLTPARVQLTDAQMDQITAGGKGGTTVKSYYNGKWVGARNPKSDPDSVTPFTNGGRKK